LARAKTGRAQIARAAGAQIQFHAERAVTARAARLRCLVTPASIAPWRRDSAPKCWCLNALKRLPHHVDEEERGKGGGDSHQVWVTAALASGVSSSIRGESDRNGMSKGAGPRAARPRSSVLPAQNSPACSAAVDPTCHRAAPTLPPATTATLPPTYSPEPPETPEPHDMCVASRPAALCWWQKS
jgi:hypothetical protein